MSISPLCIPSYFTLVAVFRFVGYSFHPLMFFISSLAFIVLLGIPVILVLVLFHKMRNLLFSAVSTQSNLNNTQSALSNSNSVSVFSIHLLSPVLYPQMFAPVFTFPACLCVCLSAHFVSVCCFVILLVSRCLLFSQHVQYFVVCFLLVHSCFE